MEVPTTILEMIKTEAAKAGIDPKLVYAICKVESSFNPLAVRYESNYGYPSEVNKWAKENVISRDTELNFQKCSWGILQVMGGVFRERGYSGFLPSILNDPQLGIHYGCLHLKSFLNKYPKREDAIASYNAGSPRKVDGEYEPRIKDYVDKVLAAYNTAPSGL